jgi:hypothetical protein
MAIAVEVQGDPLLVNMLMLGSHSFRSLYIERNPGYE